jgi:Flp pilus assembly protein TadD
MSSKTSGSSLDLGLSASSRPRIAGAGIYSILSSRRYAPIVLMIFAFLFSPRAGLAQKSSGGWSSLQIDVQLRFSDGTSGPRGVLVNLEEGTGGSADTCQTVEGGKCRFNPRNTGVYFVSVRMPGYQEVREQVDLRDVSRAYARITLRPLPAKPGQAVPKDAAGTSVAAADLAVPENARKEFDAGQKALEGGDVDKGVAHLKKATELYDTYPQAYSMLGAAYIEQKKFKEAQAVLERAVQLDPKAAGAYVQLGAALNQLKDYPGAVTALTKGLDLNPDIPAGEYELAKAYMAQQQWQNAEPPLRKTLAAQPDLAGAHVMMGNLLLKKSDLSGALNEFQTYLKLDPNGPMAPGVHDVILKIEAALAKQQQK